jgi:iron complex outermembrane receptor protein
VFLGSHKKGYVENTGPGGDFGDRDDISGRGDLRWEATDWLTADYAYDYTDIEHYQYMYQGVLTPETDHGQAEPFKRYAQQQTVYSHDRLDQMSSGSFMHPSRVRIKGHALTLTAPLGDYELKYTGSQRELFDKAYADLSGGLDTTGGQGNPEYRLDPNIYDGPATNRPEVGGPLPLAWLRTFQEQTSHELQVIGSFWDDEVRYVAGLFNYEEEGFDDRCGEPVEVCTRGTHQFHTLVDPNVPQRISNLVLTYHTSISNESNAYFGQVTWTPAQFLDSRLHLTLGYRHTEDDRSAVKSYDSRIYLEDLVNNTSQDITGPAGTCSDPSANPNGTSGNDVFDNVHVARSFSNESIAAIVAYDVMPDFNAYAKYVEAYKSGGFDTRDPQIVGDTPASDCTTYNIGFLSGFGPEYVDSVEAGFKSEWFGRSLRVNVNLFSMDYTDRQISALLQGAIQDTKTRNIGRSRLMGAELETTWAAAPGLIAGFEYEYLDAETLEVFDFNGNNVKDNYQPYSAPNNTYVGSLDWTVRDFGWSTLHGYLNYNYVDRRNGQTLPNRVGLTALGQYATLNTRVSLVNMGFFQRGRFDVALWGRNLLDEEYESTSIDNLPQADRSVIWAEPRTYGADFIYRWN